MKPVLIQSLIRHNQRRRVLGETSIDYAHGGHKDRSGFMVIMILLVMIVVALALS